MSSPLEILEVASPNMDPKDLLPIVDDPLGEQTPQTIVAPPAPTPSSVSRRRTSKKKRKRVGRACVFCQRSHMSCDDARPCKRCVARGCADQCRDPDGKRKRRGRKRKTALPEGEEGESTDSSGDEDGGDDVDVSAPVPIGGGGLHRLGKHRDELQDAFGASLDESQGSRPFFITKAKRAKLKEDWNDESDLDDVPHLAGPTSHFGGTHPIHHHHHFDEDEHVSAINGSSGHGHHGHHGHHSASSSSTTSSRPINVPSSGASHGGSAAGQHSNPMAVPSKSGNGAASNRPGAQQQQHHDDFAHFNIYPELLTLPSPASGSHQHSQMWFPSPRTTASAFAPHPFETGESHFVSSPIISGLAHSFGNSCGSTSYLNHTPTTQKGFHDFYPSGPSDNPSFDGFIL